MQKGADGVASLQKKNNAGEPSPPLQIHIFVKTYHGVKQLMIAKIPPLYNIELYSIIMKMSI